MKKLLVLLLIVTISSVTWAFPVTLGAWKADPTQNYGNLVFTLIGESVSDNVTLSIDSFFGSDYLHFAGNPTDGYIQYTVAINQSVASGWEFDGVELSSSRHPSASVTKAIAGVGTLTNNQSITLGDGYSSLTITDTFNGVVYSASNGFSTVIPEPATMLLLGLGAVLLRKKK